MGILPEYLVNIDNEFSFKTEINKIEKSVSIPNPRYQEWINDDDTKSELTVLVILGITGYTKTKTQQRARMGLPGNPIAELSKQGWFIVSLGKENEITNI